MLLSGERVALCILGLFTYIECTHIFNVERDFNKINTDEELTKHLKEKGILNRLSTFKLAVHPRIRLVYQLLQKAMAQYGHRTHDSLYNPSVYNKADHLK